MLAARRDPVFDHGKDEPSASSAAGHAGAHAASRPTGFTRLISGMQIIGTVLAVPLGLVSAYSIYHANFSPEATCGSLRTSIISMLDKNADASTLRLLVRRDVTTFERSCGTVDPDAVAAFKSLLAKPRIASAAAPKTVAKTVDRKAVAKTVDKKTVAKAVAPPQEARPDVAERPVEAATVATDSKTARGDADWLAAVRQALVAHAPVVPAQAAEAPEAPMLLAQPLARPMGKPVNEVQAAPSLPSATAVADAPARSGGNHPVPPALIPNIDPTAAAAR